MSNRASRRRSRRGKKKRKKPEGSLLLTFLFDLITQWEYMGNPYLDELSEGKRLAYDIIACLTGFIFGCVMLIIIVREGITQRDVPFLIFMLLVVLVSAWMGIRAFRGRHRKPKR